MQNETLKVKYRKIIPALFLVLGLFTLYAFFLEGPDPRAILALLWLLIAILMFAQPVMVLTMDEIRVKNLLGITLKTYRYTPAEVRRRGKVIYVRDQKVMTCSALYYPAAADVEAYLLGSRPGAGAAIEAQGN